MNTKQKLEKLEETEMAWETHAPNDTFFGMTLAQYKAKVQLSRDARTSVAGIEQQRTAAINNRERVDNENLALEQNIAKAIAGDARYGDDSDLYEGTGRVRKSEKKKGLTRRKKSEEDKE